MAIEKRGPNQWRVRFRPKGFPQQSKTFSNHADAVKWEREIIAQYSAGNLVDTTDIKGKTLGDMLDDCLKYAVTDKRGKKQEVNFIHRLKNTHLAQKQLLDITNNDIRIYRDWRLESVSPGTVIREMGMISSFYSYMRSEVPEYATLKNPVEGVKRPKAPPSRDRRVLSSNGEPGFELRMIVEATQSPVLKVLLPLAVETAMRRGELCNIAIEDINLKDGTIRLYDGMTKNGEGRGIPLSPYAVSLLAPYLAGIKGGRVFPVSYDSVSQAFRRACARAKKRYIEQCREKGVSPDMRLFDNLRLHDMRHEGTSRLFEDYGFGVEEVVSITGHKDTRQLLRYTHLSAKKLSRKMAALAKQRANAAS